jgi:hypothetical protein
MSSTCLDSEDYHNLERAGIIFTSSIEFQSQI